MKILIAYHSDTGNTKKIARSMKEGLVEEGEDVTMLPAKEVDPTILKSYDLVLLGSGIYAGAIGKTMKSLMSKVTEFAPKFAFFNTHASPTAYQKAFSRIGKKIEKNNSEILGEFDCLGENIGIPKQKQKEMLSMLPAEQRKQATEHMEKIIGRPNDVDLKRAKEFAKSLLNK
ncbi:MAG: flavodoxin family protein [Promethearchaeota archaeon]